MILTSSYEKNLLSSSLSVSNMKFLGNEKSVREAVNWLKRREDTVNVSVRCKQCNRPVIATVNLGEDFAICSGCGNEISYPMEDFAIICGNSGNGKTYLCKQLAKDFGYQLREITADDIESKEDLDVILKTINMRDMSGKKKLIVIDDVPAIRRALGRMKITRNMNKIFEIGKISNYPVIFTTDTYKKPHGGKLFPDYITEGSKKIWISKPEKYLMIKFLQKVDSEMEKSIIEEIAEKSPSVRSAVKAVRTGNINELTEENISNRQLLIMLSRRKMPESITRDNIHMLFNSISIGRKANKRDLLDVTARFADFDYCVKGKHQSIDSWIVNHLPENIENIWFSNKFRSTSFKKNAYNFDNIIKSTKEKKTSKKEKKVGNMGNMATLDGFL